MPGEEEGRDFLSTPKASRPLCGDLAWQKGSVNTDQIIALVPETVTPLLLFIGEKEIPLRLSQNLRQKEKKPTKLFC